MATFVGFVLLDEVRFDTEKYVKDLKEDWNLDYDFEITQEDNTIIADYNGMIMTANLNKFTTAKLPIPSLKAQAPLLPQTKDSSSARKSSRGLSVLLENNLTGILYKGTNLGTNLKNRQYRHVIFVLFFR